MSFDPQQPAHKPGYRGKSGPEVSNELSLRLVDLSMPIAPHFRWGPEIEVKGDIG